MRELCCIDFRLTMLIHEDQWPDAAEQWAAHGRNMIMNELVWIQAAS